MLLSELQPLEIPSLCSGHQLCLGWCAAEVLLAADLAAREAACRGELILPAARQLALGV